LFLLFFFLFSCKEENIVNKQIWIEALGLNADQYEVTIDDFAEFVQRNNIITTADSLKWSGVFDTKTNTWEVVEFANWQKPTGSKSYKKNYPVTQISYFDATVYCKHKGGRLPTALEWDLFAGDKVIIGNVWEGLFPVLDEGKDGYKNCVAPIGKFAPNKYGLHDLFGNVWEWTTTQNINGTMIIKGGSFLCDYNICSGFIPSRFQTTAKDSGLNHLGFRCVYDL